MDRLPEKTFDLLVSLRELDAETVNVGWLCSRLSKEERKELLRLDYERALRGLEE